MVFGFLDYFLIAIIVFFNVWFWSKKIDVKIGCLFVVLLFGFVFPVTSMLVELEIVKSQGGWIDNFEVAYTYLKFPIYWVIGIIQIIIVGVKNALQNNAEGTADKKNASR